MSDRQNPQLLQVLEADIDLIDALVQVLEEEKQALSERKFESLEHIALNKNTLMQQIDLNFQNRITVLKKYSDDADSDYQSLLSNYLNSIESGQSELLATLNNSLEEKLAICRDINAVNGQVISVNLNNRQQILDIVAGRNDQETYSASGKIQTPGANKHK
jgi:flagellar biosynthesis protein FlgN